MAGPDIYTLRNKKAKLQPYQDLSNPLLCLIREFFVYAGLF
jgi:hypothetical protein